MEGFLIPWVIAATILIFVAAYWIYTLEKQVHEFEARYERLQGLSEALAKAPEHAALLPLNERLDQHRERLTRLEVQMCDVERTLEHSLQGIGVVRYNAFEGLGGDQSFSLALVDAVGHGAVVTGLHTGDEVRVYAKALENWKSSHSLSADEQRALGAARRKMLSAEVSGA